MAAVAESPLDDRRDGGPPEGDGHSRVCDWGNWDHEEVVVALEAQSLGLEAPGS
jgi:hypothetical protein